MKKYMKPAVLLCELILFLCLLIPVLRFEPEEVQVGFNSFSCKGGRFDEGWGWSVDNAGKTDSFLVSPVLSLKKGSYLLTVTYEADENQTLRIVDAKNYGLILPEGTIPLGAGQKECTLRCELAADVPELTLNLGYTGSGSYSVSGITLKTDDAMARRGLCWLVLCCVLLNVFLFSRRFRKNPLPALSVLGIALLCSLPLFMDKFVDGHDCAFHLMRIEAIADSLSRSVFPLRLSSLHLDGWGYPTSVYYGDFLLYVPAVLRLIGFSVTGAYKAYVLFINLATAWVSLACFSRITKDERLGALMALIYCTCGYRLMDIYVRMAVGEYSAMLFLPLLAAGFCDLAGKSLPDGHGLAADALLLASGFAGLACTHLLSTEIAAAACVLACLCLLPRILRPRVLLTLAGGAVLSLLLAAFFAVPLLDYMKNETVSILCVPNPNASRIQVEGAHIAQFFEFFASPFGTSEYNTPAGRFALTPGIVEMAALTLACWLLLFRKGSGKLKILTGLSLLFLWLSSDVFPWDWIEETPLSGLCAIQFPWRWLAAAGLLLTLLCGALLKEGTAPRWTIPAALAACFISVCVFTGQYANGGSFIEPFDAAEIVLSEDQIGGGEYLRYDPGSLQVADSEGLTNNFSYENLDWFECLSRGGNVFLRDVMGSMDADGTIDLPEFHYRGITARDDKGNLLTVTDGPNCRVRVLVPKGFDGKITVAFEEPAAWRIAEIVSLLSLLACLAAALLLKRRTKRPENVLR